MANNTIEIDVKNLDEVKELFRQKDDEINHQVRRVKEVTEENGVLRESYNKLADDLSRGDHVDFSWIKDAIYEAAHSRTVDAFKTVYSHDKKKIEKLMGIVKDFIKIKNHPEFIREGSVHQLCMKHSKVLNEFDNSTSSSIGSES